MTELARLWRGELPLGSAFWNWAVLGGLAVNLSTSILFLVLISMEHPVVALVVGYVLSVPYNVAVTVGVWRSAARHANRRQAEAARLVTLVAMLILSLT